MYDEPIYILDVLQKYSRLLIFSLKFPRVKRGSHISYSSGFSIVHGQHTVRIGNHVSLVDTLINSGETQGVTIDDYVFFGHGVKLLARGHNPKKRNEARQMCVTEKPIHIKQGAWIASGSIVLGGVTIGEDAVVAAGSVVTKDVAPETLVAGVPARVIKKIKVINQKP